MKCKYCGSENLVLEQRSKETNNILDANQVALKCADCGKFIKWCPKGDRSYYYANTVTQKNKNDFYTTTAVGELTIDKPKQFYQQGWVCPKCGGVYSPTQNCCPHCTPPIMINVTYDSGNFTRVPSQTTSIVDTGSTKVNSNIAQADPNSNIKVTG